MVAVRRHSQDRQSPAPALPPSLPRGSACPPRGPQPGPATRWDQAKSRRISRRSRTRPFEFPNETVFVRFLSPPFHAGRAIHGPCRLFFARLRAAGQFRELAHVSKNPLQPEWWQRVLSFLAVARCPARTPAASQFALQVRCNLRCRTTARPAQLRPRFDPPRRRQPPRRRSGVPVTCPP